VSDINGPCPPSPHVLLSKTDLPPQKLLRPECRKITGSDWASWEKPS
jgi:hypothetical protein